MANLNTYWNNNGAEQEKYNEMMKADWDDEMTQASNNDMHRYYRYYNDGDLPGWARGRYDLKVFDWQWNCWKLNEKGEEELERRATEVVLREYKRYQKAYA